MWQYLVEFILLRHTDGYLSTFFFQAYSLEELEVLSGVLELSDALKFLSNDAGMIHGKRPGAKKAMCLPWCCLLTSIDAVL